MTNWSHDIEQILSKIRLKSIVLSKYHMKSYIIYRHLLIWFRIPIIVISGVSSVSSVALGHYVELESVSMICCVLSLCVAIVGSVELFLQIQSKMELHLNNSTMYCLLANDILKTISLDSIHRTSDGLVFLEDFQTHFNGLMKTSIITNTRIFKQLVKIDDNNMIEIDLFLDTPNSGSPRKQSNEDVSI